MSKGKLGGEAQTRLLEAEREAEVAAEIARTISASLDLGTVLQRVAEGAKELCGSDMARIALREPESEAVIFRHWVGSRYQRYDTLSIEAGKGVGGQVLLTGLPFRTDRYAEDPRISREYLEVVREEGVVAELAVPIQIQDRVEGLLYVDNRSPRPFTDRDEVILLRLADHAAVAIQNARLYGGLKAALEKVETSQQRIIQGERLRALGELAGGVAHDFNNVLAVIVGRAQLLLQQVDEPGLKRQLQVIEKVALDGARTVKRIQEFTRLRLAKPFQPVDMNRVVEEVVEITRSRWKDEAQAKNVHYDVMAETPHPVPAVLGEASELSEALVNIVLNALDAMPQGGRITIRTGVEGERVFVAVADTGIGMTEEVGRRVFDPFFTTKVARGSGLGLSVVYGIVKRHGGEIDVRSRVGEGSTFTVRLPVGRKIPEAPPGAPPSQPCRPAKILVIDDEEEVRNLLVDLLAGQGHAVVPCPDGQSGLARFREGRFDLVITDLGMPGMSGWEVARAIKHGRRETPVALITGWSEQIDPEDAKEKGADFLVAKPFKVREVSAVVAQALLRAERTSNV